MKKYGLQQKPSAYALLSSSHSSPPNPPTFQALKYDERYADALDCFDRACRLDPPWEAPANERARLRALLQQASTLVKTKGKLKAKKLQAMVQVSVSLSVTGYWVHESPTYLIVSYLNLVKISHVLSPSRRMAGKNLE